MEFILNLSYPSMTFEALSDDIRITRRETLTGLLNLGTLELGNLYLERVMNGHLYRALGHLEPPNFGEGRKANKIRFVVPLKDPKCMYSVNLPNTYVEPVLWIDDLHTPAPRAFLFCIYRGINDVEHVLTLINTLSRQVDEENLKLYVQGATTDAAHVMSNINPIPTTLDTEPSLHCEHLRTGNK